MLPLFTREPPFPITPFPTSAVGKEELLSLLTYNRSVVLETSLNRTDTVNNNHPIAQLLELLSIPRSYAINDATALAAKRGPAYAAALGFTSEAYEGRMTHPCLMPIQNEFILLYGGMKTYDDSDPSYWKTLSPIQYLYHPYTSTDFPLFNHYNRAQHQGFAVAALDTAELWAMYAGWLAMRSSNNSPEHFIREALLPSSLTSFTNIALFNRVVQPGASVDLPGEANIFLLPTEQKVARFAERQYQTLSKKRYGTIAALLKSIPALDNQTQLNVCRLPAIYQNRQTEWLLFTACISWLKGAQLLSPTLLSNDTGLLSTYGRMRKRFLNAGGFRGQLPPFLKEVLSTWMSEIHPS